MKVTYNWLKDFIDLRMPAHKLAEMLTMAGMEVVSLQSVKDDYVFEIEITSNRPDWLSVIGIAREIAALTGKKIKALPQGSIRLSHCNGRLRRPDFKIKIGNKKDCPLYTARIIRNVRIGHSPEWLAGRLQAVGLTPINNVVDITNYILFTTGQPLHAFDADKISGSRIIIRRARQDETIKTIDGKQRRLSPAVLLIADEQKPLAIAGIMGGRDSEVDEKTRSILLESAYFSPHLVRIASKALALSTDSSYRFERSVDSGAVIKNANLAVSMICQECAGDPSGILVSAKLREAKKSLQINKDDVSRILNLHMPFNKLKALLSGLNFKITGAKGSSFKIGLPGFRQDINCPADILEEISRIYGYDKIPSTFPAIRIQALKKNKLIGIKKIAQEIFAAAGYNEVITYSLISRETLNNINYPQNTTQSLENPLSIEQEILRPALLPGLLTIAARNAELGFSPCNIYEIGRCFSQTGESLRVGFASMPGNPIEFKGVFELMMAKFSLKYKYEAAILAAAGCYGAKIIAEGTEIGFIGTVNREIMGNFKIDAKNLLACEINLEKIAPRITHPMYKEIPKYPVVFYDISLIVDEKVAYERVRQEIEKAAEFLEAVRVKDLYRSLNLGQGKKSLTVSLSFRRPDRTFTSQELSGIIEKIIQRLKDSLGAAIR